MEFAKAKLGHTDRRDQVQAIFSRGAGHTRQEKSTLLKKLSWANSTSICVGKPPENGLLKYKAEAAKPLPKNRRKGQTGQLLGSDHKTTGNKSKRRQMGLYQMKWLL